MNIQKRVLLLILICSVLCTASIGQAADITIEDPVGDVFDITLSKVTSSDYIDIDNIDIVEITYTKSGSTITLTLQVNGLIEDRGDYDEYLAAMEGDPTVSIDMVSYGLGLTTTDLEGNELTYAINYVNQVCNLTISEDYLTETYEKITTFSVDTDTLTVSFDLQSTNEIYSTFLATTQFIQMDLAALMSGEIDEETELPWYLDEVNILVLEVDAGVSYSGTEDEAVSFTGEAYSGIEPYSWYWEFGDGETSTQQNPSHTYDDPGEYTATLTVTDDEGTEASDEASVTIAEKTNGNGSNDDTNGVPSNLILFGVIIAIIAAVGIGVIIYILRR